jgi:hypothetical protein
VIGCLDALPPHQQGHFDATPFLIFVFGGLDVLGHALGRY